MALVSEFDNLHEMFIKKFHEYAEEVLKHIHSKRDWSQKTIIISKKQKIITENYLSLTREELEKKIEEHSMCVT